MTKEIMLENISASEVVKRRNNLKKTIEERKKKVYEEINLWRNSEKDNRSNIYFTVNDESDKQLFKEVKKIMEKQGFDCKFSTNESTFCISLPSSLQIEEPLVEDEDSSSVLDEDSSSVLEEDGDKSFIGKEESLSQTKTTPTNEKSTEKEKMDVFICLSQAFGKSSREKEIDSKKKLLLEGLTGLIKELLALSIMTSGSYLSPTCLKMTELVEALAELTTTL